MKHPQLTTTTILACVIALLGAGCSKNKDATVRSLRAETGNLNSRLGDLQSQLESSDEERARLQTANQELVDQIASLEREKQLAIDSLQFLRDEDAKVAKTRISELSAQIYNMRRDLEALDALNSQKETQLAERARTIEQMESSIEAQRTQLAALEGEKTALAEALQKEKKKRSRGLLVLGVAVVASVTAGAMTRAGRARRRATRHEAGQRMQTAGGNLRAP